MGRQIRRFYTVDVEVEYAFDVKIRNRRVIVPHHIEASLKWEAEERALDKERTITREFPKVGEPKVVGSRKIEVAMR